MAQIYQTKILLTKKYYTESPKLSPKSKQRKSDEEISDIISDLNIRKSTGSNSTLTKVMKKIEDAILAPLAKLINRSFHNGVFPNILKIAEVIPIFKSESRVACNNYWLISLLCNIGKITEKLMHKHLYSFLETQNCFYAAQFGFQLNMSTNNALMSIIENIQTQLDEGKYCTGVFVDLEKAFDTVNHNIHTTKKTRLLWHKGHSQ